MKRFLEKCLICIVVMTIMSNFIMSIPVSFAYINEPEILKESRVVQGEKKDYYTGAQASNPDVELGNGGTPGAGTATDIDDNPPTTDTDDDDGKTTTSEPITIGGLFSGLVGLLTWPIRAIFMAIATGLNGILTAFMTIGIGSASSVEGAGGVDDFFLTPFHVFFNKIEILDVNFLNLNTTNSTVLIFRQAVAGWYYTMRLIASMVLLVILVYIGIRMAISTIASEKAMYKKMLVDWVSSLVLLFLLHYIMIFTFACNDALVNAMAQVTEDTEMSLFMTNLTLKALDPIDAVLSFTSIIVYCMVIFQTLSFIIAYVKRMLTIGFLIIIAPLITITYSIDRIGDGKAQALNKWLEEFVYNILIQPFHCILFLSFAKVAMGLLTSDITNSNLATAVLAILCIQYIKTGEDLVKKIFGFGQADSLATMAAGAALSMAAISKGGAVGKAVGGVAAKGVRLAKKGLANSPKALDKIKKSNVAQKAGALATGASNAVKNSPVGQAVGSAASTAAKAVTAPGRWIATKASEKLNQNAEKRLINGGTSNPTPAQIEEERKKGIVGKVKNATHSAGKATLKLGTGVKNGIQKGTRYVAHSDVGKYMQKNSGKIVGAMFGTVVGAAGLANGAAGMMAGYNVGSGLVQGYLANSAGTVNKEMNGLCQASTNMDGEGNTEEKMLMIKAIGDSEGFKDIGKKLDALKEQLNKLGLSNNQSQMAWGNIHRQLIADPASVTRDTIRDALQQTNDFDKLSPDQQEAAVELMANHTNFMAQASLYNSMKNAEGLGFDIQEMAGIVGNKTPNEGSYVRPETMPVESTENAEVDEKQVEIDIQEFANSMVKDLGTSTKDLTRDLEGTIASLKRMLNQFESANASQQQQIANAINAHGEVESSSNTFANPEQIKDYLNDRINKLEGRI